MRKNHVRAVIVHAPEGTDPNALAEKTDQFYCDIIARRLEQSGLSARQKTEVLNRIQETLRERNV